MLLSERSYNISSLSVLKWRELTIHKCWIICQCGRISKEIILIIIWIYITYCLTLKYLSYKYFTVIKSNVSNGLMDLNSHFRHPAAECVDIHLFSYPLPLNILFSLIAQFVNLFAREKTESSSSQAPIKVGFTHVT